MKRALEIQVGDRVFDRGISFKVREILIDAYGLIRFIDMQGHMRGPYVPNEFIGVKRPEENGDCNQFEILKQFATPEEVRQDEEQILHDDGLCNPDRCLVCLDEAMERRNREELEAKTCACGHVKERHYWTRKRGETVQLCRDCRECLGFERPDPENGFTVAEIQSRWAYERQAEINARALEHLEPLREALKIKTVNFMFDSVFGPRRRTGEQ